MNLVYFKADIGNFGDDLNPWLWEKLLGDFGNYPKNIDFIGIGSILDERILEGENRKKIIFGSGVRDVNFYLPKNADIETKFVRGPISSRILGDNIPYISDAAYCLRLLKAEEKPKKFKISYIPYFRNYHHFNWQIFEKVLGIHVINPCQKVETVISEIQASEKVLTSAMHGAILADIYRVPWMRVRFSQMGYESNFTSELKWQDWLRSISKQEIPTHNFDFNLNNKIEKKHIPLVLYKFYKKFRNNNNFSLSNENIITEITEKLYDEVSSIKQLSL